VLTAPAECASNAHNMGMEMGVPLFAPIGITKFPAISAQCHRPRIGTPIATSLPVNDDYRRRSLKPLLAEVQEQCAK
jgi:hypothetical protein